MHRKRTRHQLPPPEQTPELCVGAYGPCCNAVLRIGNPRRAARRQSHTYWAGGSGEGAQSSRHTEQRCWVQGAGAMPGRPIADGCRNGREGRDARAFRGNDIKLGSGAHAREWNGIIKASQARSLRRVRALKRAKRGGCMPVPTVPSLRRTWMLCVRHMPDAWWASGRRPRRPHGPWPLAERAARPTAPHYAPKTWTRCASVVFDFSSAASKRATPRRSHHLPSAGRPSAGTVGQARSCAGARTRNQGPRLPTGTCVRGRTFHWEHGASPLGAGLPAWRDGRDQHHNSGPLKE
jgi:hypothetical protein